MMLEDQHRIHKCNEDASLPYSPQTKQNPSKSRHKTRLIRLREHNPPATVILTQHQTFWVEALDVNERNSPQKYERMLNYSTTAARLVPRYVENAIVTRGMLVQFHSTNTSGQFVWQFFQEFQLSVLRLKTSLSFQSFCFFLAGSVYAHRNISKGKVSTLARVLHSSRKQMCCIPPQKQTRKTQKYHLPLEFEI